MYGTDWTEPVEPGEDARFEGYVAELRTVKEQFDARYGERARALHRQAHAGVRATFTVRDDLAAAIPRELHVGPFTPGARFDAYVRFSNGGFARVKKDEPDVRGVAIKLLGVAGPKALGDGPTQDFLLNQTPRSGVRSPEEFVALTTSAARGPLVLPWALASRVGVGRAFGILKDTLGGFTAPFSSFASEQFWSMVPYRMGPTVARWSLRAVDVQPRVGATLASDLVARLRGGARWSFMAQLFQDAARTPTEDATRDWDAPWIDLATLEVAPVDVSTGPGAEVAAYVERLAFDPWHAVEELRPVGAFNRLRRAAYFAASAEHRDVVAEADVR